MQAEFHGLRLAACASSLAVSSTAEALGSQTMQQAAASGPAHRPAPPELVPVQLALAGSREWVLWPVGATDEELVEFSENLALDLGAGPQLSAVVAEAVRQQVADWVAHVPPPPAGAEPRRELVRCG